MSMQEITTCGNNPRTFLYNGDALHGVVIQHTNATYKVSHAVFSDLLDHFIGKIVPGGFSTTNPIPGGVGEYLSHQTIQPLTPRHGSFICAILRHENFVTCRTEGNTIMVHFLRNKNT